MFMKVLQTSLTQILSKKIVATKPKAVPGAENNEAGGDQENSDELEETKRSLRNVMTFTVSLDLNEAPLGPDVLDVLACSTTPLDKLKSSLQRLKADPTVLGSAMKLGRGAIHGMWQPRGAKTTW